MRMSIVSAMACATMLAVLTAAKASGEQVRIGTNGCISTPMGNVPRIDWVDLGNRL